MRVAQRHLRLAAGHANHGRAPRRRFRSREHEKSGRLRIADVLPLGPAALAGIKPGDDILQVDGRPTGAHVNLDELLDHTIGKRVALSVVSSAAGAPATAAPREVGVKPVNQATEKGLRYRQWVDERRDYVAKASGGRLGYAHMLDMSAGALAQLNLDLDAENHARQGVVIDIRNNNGGFVNVYAIDVLTRRGYFNMARRGLPIPPVSSRTALGQRALELPTILVTNQHSLSDAEDFTEGYRTLKLGKVVGEPTAGWIIYTSDLSLFDRTSPAHARRQDLRPRRGADGNAPRPVDVPVTRPVGGSYRQGLQPKRRLRSCSTARKKPPTSSKNAQKAHSAVLGFAYSSIVRSAIAKSRNPTPPRASSRLAGSETCAP